MREKIIILLIVLSALNPLYAEGHPCLPDTIVTQFAGYIGFISAGAGYEFFNEKLSLEMLYGYVPPSEAGIDIHMITGRAIYSPFSFSPGAGYTLYPLTLGIFLNYAIGDQYRVTWPSTYPAWYYRPTALYTGESAGIRIKKETGGDTIKAVEFYADVVTMGEFIYEYRHNDNIDFHEILSLAFGARIHF